MPRWVSRAASVLPEVRRRPLGCLGGGARHERRRLVDALHRHAGIQPAGTARLNETLDMKTLEQQMGFYAAYHQDARNKATHFIGVPAIMLSLFIPLGWLRFELGGVAVSAAMLFAAAVLLYYFLLDVPLALAMLLITGILVWAGERIV